MKDRRGVRGRIWPRPAKGRSGRFAHFARASARATGHPWAFALALATILVWVVTGPLFQFSDTWQLVINTATTIVTFLMVFLIQTTQNRDSEAVQLKLDELIRASEAAHNALLDLEELSECDLDRIRARYLQLARNAREDLRAGRTDQGSPEVIPGVKLRPAAQRANGRPARSQGCDASPTPPSHGPGNQANA